MLLCRLLSRSGFVKPVFTAFSCSKPSYFNTTAAVLPLKVGDKASLSKTFNAVDVQAFSEISLDKNPVHLDPEFASKTIFGKPIVHAVLTLGLLSGVLASKLPGPGSVLLSFTVETPAPLFVGEVLTAEVTVKEISGRKVKIDFRGFTEEDKTVAKGVAHLLVPKHIL